MKVGVTPQNVGEAKLSFQEEYGEYRIPSMPAQAFINSMLMQQFALISPSYKYSRVFSLGFESLCTVFLEGTSTSPKDAADARLALYSALGLDEAKSKADAEALMAEATGKSEAELFETDDFKAIKDAKDFKYSYQFGSGLIALMKLVNVEPSEEAIDRWCTQLELTNAGVLKRDFAFYESQLTKLEQLKEMLLQMTAASKRNEAARLKEKADAAAKEASKAEAEAAAENATTPA